MRIKRTLKIALPLLLVLAGAYNCMHDKTRNYETATITRDGELYRIELTGTRYLMVHNPFALLMMPTHEATYVLSVPRIEGAVTGGEIPVERGYYKLLGGIAFEGDRMTVDLYYDNYDDKIRDPLSWNGDYTIKPTEGGE